MSDEPLQPVAAPVEAPVAVKREAGKLGSYLFALIVSLFLGYQCLVADKNNREVPPLTFLSCFTLIGTALGVTIDAGAIGQFFVPRK
ncbi:hypothetical protein H6F86_20840 [Phormidium sp. FACHB-592]|uniref:Uncharacterized protein n=1 Tax=Stenomitos frigidus AS-A4 TaxID=2933935 RepID=A0ABV0KEL1_9CYAN|nr:hypothetical protein [Phormidium sp. FACHB-592]MBD2076281.1 hypothetical protein [Phormidium sp. FACHB-592]